MSEIKLPPAPPPVITPQFEPTRPRRGRPRQASGGLGESENLRVRLLTLREVAHYLRVHAGTVYRLVKAGNLPAIRVGRDLRFDMCAVEQWVANGGTAQSGSPRHRK